MSDQPKEVRLIVLTGAHVGQEVLVDGEASLGRLPACDLVIDDKLASRKHARVKILSDGVYLEDLSSSNGTRINDQRIKEVRLENGDQFEIGHVRVRVRIQEGNEGSSKGEPGVAEESQKPPAARPPSPPPHVEPAHSEGLDEIQLEGLEDERSPAPDPAASAATRPPPPCQIPVSPAMPSIPIGSGQPQAAPEDAQAKAGSTKGHRGRGGGLQYSRVEDRGGLLGQDLWQRSGLSRILLLALAMAAGAGLFFLAYHAVS